MNYTTEIQDEEVNLTLLHDLDETSINADIYIRASIELLLDELCSNHRADFMSKHSEYEYDDYDEDYARAYYEGMITKIIVEG